MPCGLMDYLRGLEEREPRQPQRNSSATTHFKMGSNIRRGSSTWGIVFNPVAVILLVILSINNGKNFVIVTLSIDSLTTDTTN